MTKRNASRIDTLSALLDASEAEIARFEEHFDGSYESLLAAEAAGDAEAVARHGQWVEIFDSMLVSLRAGRYALQAEYNGILLAMEAA
jgi:hypothetical protein